MSESLRIEQLAECYGARVCASDGTEVGHVDEIFCDRETLAPEWIGVGVGFFEMKRVLVPVSGAEIGDAGVRLPFATSTIRDSPHVAGEEVTDDVEAELRRHYGLEPHAVPDDSGAVARLVRWTPPEQEVEAEIQQW